MSSSSFWFMPDRLRNLLTTNNSQQILREYSGLELYCLPDLSAYLKIGEIKNNSNLAWEYKVLMWLEGKVNVPKVLGFEVVDGYEYLLISEIRGQTFADWLEGLGDASRVEHLTEMVARRLRAIHDLVIDPCDLDQRLAAKIVKAEENIRGGFVDESDFDEENLGMTAERVLDELRESLPLNEDLVFTHGDLSLPNIIIGDVGDVGFIDLDKGGVADRYQDIAIFLRSFRFNPSTINIEPAFCRGYGIGELDEDKIDFYRKLDELF